MKKLLAVLSVISVMGPSSLAMMSATTKINPAPQHEKYVLNSFKNVVKVLNWKWDPDERLDTEYVDWQMDRFSWDVYRVSVDQKDWDQGTVFELDSTPRNDTRTIKTYEDTYKNNTSSEQIARTQSRVERITESHEFSMNLTDKTTSDTKKEVSGKIKFPYIEIGGGVSFNFSNENSNGRSWSDARTTTTEETAPSQELKQNPYTILHVKYSIKQSTIDYNGYAQFKINNLISKNIHIPFITFTPDATMGDMFWEWYSINDIVKTLKDEGYGDQLIKNKINRYSVLTVDNIDNPRIAYLNLPIQWSSSSSILDLEYYEESIPH